MQSGCRQSVVVIRGRSLKARMNHLLCLWVEVAFKELAYFLVKKLKQNFGPSIVSLIANFWLGFDMKKPLANCLPFNLNTARCASKKRASCIDKFLWWERCKPSSCKIFASHPLRRETCFPTTNVLIWNQCKQSLWCVHDLTEQDIGLIDATPSGERPVGPDSLRAHPLSFNN